MTKKKRSAKKTQDPSSSGTSHQSTDSISSAQAEWDRVFPPNERAGVMNAEQVALYASRTNVDPSQLKGYDFNKRSRDKKFIFHDAFFPSAPFIQGEVVVAERFRELLPEPFPLLPFTDPVYRVAVIEGKGEGMFATRDIPLGGVIVNENPVMVTPTYRLEDLTENGGILMAFDRLDEQGRNEIMKLANCKPPEVCGREEGIVRTNGIAIDLHAPPGTPEIERTHSGIFLKTSKCNHSCGPNARYKWDGSSFSLRLTAVRPIRVGEEITVAYMSLTMSREARRQKLKTMYLFDCECPYCALPDAKGIAESDRFRTQLGTMDRDQRRVDIKNWLYDLSMSADAIIKILKREIDLIEKEGLEREVQYVYNTQDMVTLYCMLGDEKNARLWAQRAKGLAYMRDNRGWVEEFEEILTTPSSMKIWGARKRRTCV